MQWTGRPEWDMGIARWRLQIQRTEAALGLPRAQGWRFGLGLSVRWWDKNYDMERDVVLRGGKGQ